MRHVSSNFFEQVAFPQPLNSGLYDDGHAYVATSTTPPMIIVKVVIIANHYLDDAVQPQHPKHLGRARAALSSITRGLRAEFYKSSGRLSKPSRKSTASQKVLLGEDCSLFLNCVRSKVHQVGQTVAMTHKSWKLLLYSL